jgi:hypothetical protein
VPVDVRILIDTWTAFHGWFLFRLTSSIARRTASATKPVSVTPRWMAAIFASRQISGGNRSVVLCTVEGFDFFIN